MIHESTASIFLFTTYSKSCTLSTFFNLTIITTELMGTWKNKYHNKIKTRNRLCLKMGIQTDYSMLTLENHFTRSSPFCLVTIHYTELKRRLLFIEMVLNVMVLKRITSRFVCTKCNAT